MLSKLKIPTHIKKIVILGNISKNSLNFLENLFKKKIIAISLPYGDSKEIIKSIKYNFQKNDLVFLTLPSPKQEQIAEYISKENKFYKIICIGASVAMLSGDEKPVPNFLTNFEFLWRLKTDPIRRIKRLIVSFFYFNFGYLFKKNAYFTYKYARK